MVAKNNMKVSFNHTYMGTQNIDGFLQGCSHSIANALDLLHSGTMPLI